MTYAECMLKEDKRFYSLCSRFAGGFLSLHQELHDLFTTTYRDTLAAGKLPIAAENAGRAAVNSRILAAARKGGMDRGWREYLKK